MNSQVRAIEATGHVDENGDLHLDERLHPVEPGRVRVIVLFADDGRDDDTDWLKAAATNPAFEFLRDPAEDVYRPSDGESFRDEG